MTTGEEIAWDAHSVDLGDPATWLSGADLAKRIDDAIAAAQELGRAEGEAAERDRIITKVRAEVTTNGWRAEGYDPPVIELETVFQILDKLERGD